MPRTAALVPALALGVAIGATAQLAEEVDPRLYWLTALGVPWLLAAFVAGALARDRALGAVGGAVALVAGTLTYYVLQLALFDVYSPLRTALVATGWLAASAAAGAAFGLAGAVWRTGADRVRAAGTALVGGALVGESLLLLGEWESPGGRAVLWCELAAGAALPFALARRRGLAVVLALTLVVAVGAGAAEAGVRDALRHAGWSGA